jgi:3-oxoacyl-[acyl-carrier-protein] synthase III
MRARITGTGSYVPPKIVSNADLEKMVATSDEWIAERTGIRARRVAGSGEACSDLALKAAQRALESAKIGAADLDMILLATCTGDYPLRQNRHAARIGRRIRGHVRNFGLDRSQHLRVVR